MAAQAAHGAALVIRELVAGIVSVALILLTLWTVGACAGVIWLGFKMTSGIC